MASLLVQVQPLPRSRARGGSQDEEKLLLYDSALNIGGGRAAVHSVSDCQKYLLPPFRFIRLKSKISSTKAHGEWRNVSRTLQNYPN